MLRIAVILLWIVFAATVSNPVVAAHADNPSTELENAELALDLTLYAGKVVYLDFWASWCAPCKQSFPWMIELQEQLGDQGLVILTVNVDRDSEKATRFLEQVESDLPVIYDPKGQLAAEYELEAMPSSYIYDRAGVLRAMHVGFHPDKLEEIEAELQVLLNERVDDAQED